MPPVPTYPPQLPAELSLLAPRVVEPLVRIGSAGDGGYVLPQRMLERSEFLVSLGINDDWSFDLDFAARSRLKGIHAYDHTISEKTFVQRARKSLRRLLHGKATLERVRQDYALLRSFRSFFGGPARHYAERVNHWPQHSHDVSLQTILERVPCDRIFLKIDIEGAEYGLVDTLVSQRQRITGLAMEWHFCDVMRLSFLDAVRRLQVGYDLVHIHGNNHGTRAPDGLPESLELSFVNRDLLAGQPVAYRSDLPLPGLDAPNKADAADYPLRFVVPA